MDGAFDVDVDDVLDYDDDWLYIEDDLALSDELAENQISSPGYCGTNYDISLESYEFELYEYWNDLDYADDAYWEYGSAWSRQEKHAGGQQAKPHTRSKSANELNRRKSTRNAQSTAETYSGQNIDPIIFRSREERDRHFLAGPPLLTERSAFAFMPDWRRRYTAADGNLPSQSMPADMRRAAETNSNEILEPLVPHISDDDDDGDDDDDDDDADSQAAITHNAIAGTDDSMPDVDPQILAHVLRQKLGDAGLQGMDENMFMHIINQMVSGSGGAEDATGNLVSTLLENTMREGNDGHVTDWLSQQGIRFEEDDASGSTNDSQLENITTGTQTNADIDDVEGSSAGLQASNKPSTGTSSEGRKRRFSSEADARPKRRRELSNQPSHSHLRRDSVSVVGSGTESQPDVQLGARADAPRSSEQSDEAVTVSRDHGSMAAGLSTSGKRKRAASLAKSIDSQSAETFKTTKKARSSKRREKKD